VDPIFEGLVEHDLPLGFGLADLPPIDAIALTHGHLDHLNAPTLAALPDKSVPVVHPPAGFTELAETLRRLGYQNLHERAAWEPFELGSARIVPTPSLGVLDECAYVVEGRSGRFFDGGDAPQPPLLIEEIAKRFGSFDCAALSHNSFDMPALLGLPSHKSADHGPEGGVRTARILGTAAAIAAASNMRWCGPDGDAITKRVIRRSRRSFVERLREDAPAVEPLDLRPGDAWSREGGVEQGVLRGAPAPRVGHDYVHLFLDTGERYCPAGRPALEDTFRRDLPARLAAARTASLEVAQQVCFEIEGEEAASFTVDFSRPEEPPVPRDAGASCAVRVACDDWKDLFERKLPWQVLLSSDRLRVRRFEPGVPPAGLHFVYALQAVFP
jgi:L-ascorbate metabolism protein UlaG (beta-lactamase superfamily)